MPPRNSISQTRAEPPAKKPKKDEGPGAGEEETAACPAASQGEVVVRMAPELKSGEDASTDENMILIIPWVLQALPAALRANPLLTGEVGPEPLNQHKPLEIKHDEAKLKSYKAPWRRTEVEASLRTTKLYEAAGNILWCVPRPAASWGQDSADDDPHTAQVIAGDPPTWADVEAVARLHFSHEALVASCSESGSVGRLVFPIVVPVHVSTVSAAAVPEKGMAVISGHVYLYGWYLAVFRAVAQRDEKLLAALWQVGLTTTIFVRLNLKPHELAVFSMQQSEARKTQKNVYSDTFVAFSLKAMLVMRGAQGGCGGGPATSRGAKEQLLEATKVTFNGAPVNKAMLGAISLFEQKISSRCIEAMRRIEKQHGKDVLSSSYTKLARIGGICTSLAPKLGRTVADLFDDTVESLEFALHLEQVKPHEVTVEYLDKPRNNKTPGLVMVAAARHT